MGGVPEVIEHGTSGYLADVGDVDTMARYALELLGDDNKLRSMAKQARAVAQSRFCSSKIVPQYEAFYRRVLEDSHIVAQQRQVECGGQTGGTGPYHGNLAVGGRKLSRANALHQVIEPVRLVDRSAARDTPRPARGPPIGSRTI